MKSNKKLKKNRLLRNRCKERKRRRRNNTLFFENIFPISKLCKNYLKNYKKSKI